MSNPYIKPDPSPPIPSPGPNPGPNPKSASDVIADYLPIITLAIAVLACWLPSNGEWKSPIPIPPFVEPVDPEIDPEKTKGAWVLLFEETADITPEVTEIKRFLTDIHKRGLQYRPYDVDSKDAIPYKDIFEGKELPYLVILYLENPTDKEGTILFQGKADLETLDADIKKSTGR